MLPGSTNLPTVDIDTITVMPSDGQDGVEVTYPDAALAQLGQWQIDINQHGYVSCQIYDAATGTVLIGQATVKGQLTVGPHDTVLVTMPEVSDGAGHFVPDAQNCRFSLQSIVTS